MSLASTVDFF